MNLPTAFLHLSNLLAQADTTYSTSTSTGGAIGGGIGGLLGLVIAVVVLIGMAKVFIKAGKPGWAVIVPIYNVIVLLQIAGKPLWWFILFIIPFVNFIVAILVCIDIAKNFGKDTLYGLGLAFLGPIFFPMLGFGSARYVGAGGSLAGYPPAGYPPATT